jgi:hypothetical protein
MRGGVDRAWSMALISTSADPSIGLATQLDGSSNWVAICHMLRPVSTRGSYCAPAKMSRLPSSVGVVVAVAVGLIAVSLTSGASGARSGDRRVSSRRSRRTLPSATVRHQTSHQLARPGASRASAGCSSLLSVATPVGRSLNAIPAPVSKGRAIGGRYSGSAGGGQRAHRQIGARVTARIRCQVRLNRPFGRAPRQHP